MSTQTLSAVRADLEVDDWSEALVGKTIRGVRPTHDNGPVPDVTLLFTDGTTAIISVLDEVYFEACLINTLRKTQPVVAVNISDDQLDERGYVVEIRSRTFPLLVLRAVNKGRPPEDFPFRLTWVSA